MTHLLCRREIRDYVEWRTTFDAESSAHQAAGLRLLNIWQTRENKNEVFCLFEVESVDDAMAFLAAPETRHKARKSGVTSGECHFLEAAKSYSV